MSDWKDEFSKTLLKIPAICLSTRGNITVEEDAPAGWYYQREGVESLLSKQRAELVEKVREIGDTSDYPEWEGSAGINVGLIPKERVIALIKDTDEVAEEKNK